MTKLKLNYELDPEEKEMLRSVEAGEWVSVPNAEKERREMRQAAINTIKLRKSANLNIRVQPDTLVRIKKRATRAGMRYQTLIGLLLERFASGKITITL